MEVDPGIDGNQRGFGTRIGFGSFGASFDHPRSHSRCRATVHELSRIGIVPEFSLAVALVLVVVARGAGGSRVQGVLFPVGEGVVDDPRAPATAIIATAQALVSASPLSLPIIVAAPIVISRRTEIVLGERRVVLLVPRAPPVLVVGTLGALERGRAPGEEVNRVPLL